MMVMIALPIFVLAAAIGVVLAALESPHVPGQKWIERLSAVLVAAGAATVTIGGVLVVRGWLLD
jgi:hypothetical protein